MFEQFLLATSLWLTPVSTTPPAAPALAQAIIGLDSWVRPDDWTIPVYTATASDPQQTLLYNADTWSKVASGAWKRSGNSADVEKQILASSRASFPCKGNVYSTTSVSSWTLPADFSGKYDTAPATLRFNLGAQMKPAPGWDGHIVVMQPTGKVLEAYGAIRLSSGQLVALSYAVTDPHHNADGWENGQTASMVPVYTGLVDDDSVNAGAINHAMAITVPAGVLKPAATYPAYAFDRGALTESPPYGGNLPMGARLALPKGTNIDSLGLTTPEGRVIATAAAKYGFFIVDRGGSGISLRVRRNPVTPNARLRAWNGPLQDDLNRIFARVVQAW